MKRPYRRIKESILKRLKEGMPVQDIVQELECGWTNVRKYAIAYGLPYIIREPYTEEEARLSRNANRRRYYDRNLEAQRDESKQRSRLKRAAIYKKVYQFLAENPCVDCQESDIVVLEFDHVRGEKVDGIANMCARNTPWDIIQAEIEKCDVRCANCHKRKTAKQLGWRKYGGSNDS